MSLTLVTFSHEHSLEIGPWRTGAVGNGPPLMRVVVMSQFHCRQQSPQDQQHLVYLYVTAWPSCRIETIITSQTLM